MMITLIVANTEAWEHGRRNPSQPRHCARSKAIAHTADGFGVLETASYLAVTAAVLRKGINPNTPKNIGNHLITLNSYFLILNFKVILLNHENHFNHIQITVQTNEHGGRTVSRTDVARNVSTAAGTATTASRLNCDFRLIILIHMIKRN
jgi:hypothetical protein